MTQQPDDLPCYGIGLRQVAYVLKSVANGDDQSAVAVKCANICKDAAKHIETDAATITELRQRVAKLEADLRDVLDRIDESYRRYGFEWAGDDIAAFQAIRNRSNDHEG